MADWKAAADRAKQTAEVKAARRAAGSAPTLNRSTIDFIRDGAGVGDRHRLLYSAAANLGEFGCPSALAVALLEDSALDSGLTPKDVRRQIECGLAATKPQGSLESTEGRRDDDNPMQPQQPQASGPEGSEGQSCRQLTGATGSTPNDLQAALARLWGSTPAPTAAPGQTLPVNGQGSPAMSPLPPLLRQLPPGTVGTGTLDPPCRCGSTEYAEVGIAGGRTRRDCRECGRFMGWGKWSDQGGLT